MRKPLISTQHRWTEEDWNTRFGHDSRKTAKRYPPNTSSRGSDQERLPSHDRQEAERYGKGKKLLTQRARIIHDTDVYWRRKDKPTKSELMVEAEK